MVVCGIITCFLLRYFTRTNVTEHIIPTEILRMRDPKTGLPRTKFHTASLSRSDNDTKTTESYGPISVKPKGTYGVAIVWNDELGTSDIYSYDALRLVAINCCSSS